MGVCFELPLDSGRVCSMQFSGYGIYRVYSQVPELEAPFILL